MSDEAEVDPSGGTDGQAVLDPIFSHKEAISEADQEVLDMICQEITQRPHLAFPLVDWMIPEVTFAPSKCLTGPGSKRFAGRIGFLHAEKGFSFILSTEAKDLFGTDVFLHSAQRGHYQVNDQVNFAVLLNKHGKPQAFDLTPVGSANDLSLGAEAASALKGQKGGKQSQKAGGGKGVVVPAPQPFAHKGKGAPKGGGGKPVVVPAPQRQAFASPAPEISPGSTTTGERHTGMVSAFKPEKNFGFLQCAETFAQYGKDLWVHGEQIKDFKVGDTVSFTLILSKTGAPQAIDLETPRAAGSWSRGVKRPATVMTAPAAATAADVDSRYNGHVTSVYPEKNFGFIKCDETFAAYGKDLWVHGAQLQNFTVNDTVSFTLVLNKNGQPQAQNLTPVGGEMAW